MGSSIVIRPRGILVVALTVAAVGMPAAILKLSYDAATFDPRIVVVVPEAIALVVVAGRARLVVGGDRTLRRGRLALALDRLTAVEVRRPRYLKQEGLVRPLVEVRDDSGNVVRFKPALWSSGAGPLLAVLHACARAQGVELDERTDRRLSTAATEHFASIPAWAYRSATSAAPPPRPAPRSTFWTRRSPDGTPRKAQAQRLLPIVVVLAAGLPLMLGIGRVGTRAIRSARCRADRARWTTAADVPGASDNIFAAVGRVPATAYPRGTPSRYLLRADGIVNEHNTDAVQRDAAALVEGYLTVWDAGPDRVADLQLERFASHEAALAFQRDYAEDHCHAGDTSFAVPAIAGAVGLRCDCLGRDSGDVAERVAFVRGATRVQAIVWRTPRRSGHAEVEALAAAGERAIQPLR